MTSSAKGKKAFGYRFCSRLLMVVAICLLGQAAHAAPQFWVSPQGSDSANGTVEHPFQTLTRARDAVRSLGGEWDGDVIVNLGGGVYHMDAPLVLEPQDSGRNGHSLVWRAVSGETPVLSGAITVTDWQAHPGRDNVFVARIEPGTNSRQLFVDGLRRPRAATTDYPVSFLPDGRNGILYAKTSYNDPAWADPLKWDNPAEVDAVLVTQWKMMICGVESVQEIEPGLGILLMKDPAWSNANSFFQADAFQKDAYVHGLWGFWQVTRFENSLSFLDQPGEWALDSVNGLLYYMPVEGEDLATALVELPVAQELVVGRGTSEEPLSNVSFEGITFCHATWLRPSGDQGYVADQSGVTLVGKSVSNVVGHIQPNTIGDAQRLAMTPGNLAFEYARGIVFTDNLFQGLGAVALELGTGCQNSTISNNKFGDISSSAVQIGGISEEDHHPPTAAHATSDNTVFNNLIQETGRDYYDSAAIFVGCTTRTTIENNTIDDCPWSGIAMGWGWGLLDPGSFPGLPGAYPGMWGFFDTPSATSENKILNNRIENFLQKLWDGGAVYTTGAQGDSPSTGALIMGNVAMHKRPDAGSNIFYTDGGSRYVTLASNVSFDNPRGKMYFGPPPNLEAPLPYSILPSLANGLPYGKSIGGCRTHGDIYYLWNYWQHGTFYNPCPYTDENGVSYPRNMWYMSNVTITSLDQVPDEILENAGYKEDSGMAGKSASAKGLPEVLARSARELATDKTGHLKMLERMLPAKNGL